MEIVRRGYEPRDAEAFGPRGQTVLRDAMEELRFLLNRGYELKSASTFICNHYLLSERQRMALARVVSADAALEARRGRELAEPPEVLILDGFNTIITLEVALSGSLLLEGMDGTVRDLAGLRGTYRVVDKTLRAADLLLDRLERLEVRRAEFLLDRQVSNSGRLRALLLESEHAVRVQVELHPGVDGQLSRMKNVVTTDAIILDKCESWYNLNRDLIAQAVPDAWIFRLAPPLT